MDWGGKISWWHVVLGNSSPQVPFFQVGMRFLIITVRFLEWTKMLPKNTEYCFTCTWLALTVPNHILGPVCCIFWKALFYSPSQLQKEIVPHNVTSLEDDFESSSNGELHTRSFQFSCGNKTMEKYCRKLQWKIWFFFKWVSLNLCVIALFLFCWSVLINAVSFGKFMDARDF